MGLLPRKPEDSDPDDVIALVVERARAIGLRQDETGRLVDPQSDIESDRWAQLMFDGSEIELHTHEGLQYRALPQNYSVDTAEAFLLTVLR